MNLEDVRGALNAGKRVLPLRGTRTTAIVPAPDGMRSGHLVRSEIA